MFDDVPVRVWLLIAIAAFAWVPAFYVYRHFVHAPSRRDITQPAQDLRWRTSRDFIRNLAILALLIAVAVFIFTPTAEKFARSPRFLPLFTAAIGAWAVFLVAQGFISGRIQLLMRGFYATYERDAQPKRYWASMTWNALLGCMLLWFAHEANVDASSEPFADASAEASADTCVEAKDVEFLPQQLAACDQWISLRPDDPEAHLQRGLIYLELGAYDRAIAEMTRAHELDPRDPWPLANRGLARAWKNEGTKAQADFAVVRSVDPSNPVMLRGEALLMKSTGDLQGAVDGLTQSMKREPDNLWALRTRSELYWELGEYEKSAQDDQRWVRLNKKAHRT